MCNTKEPYSVKCAEKLKELTIKYPYNFWADPEAFFNGINIFSINKLLFIQIK